MSSSSGTGRGRGWLNLNKNSTTTTASQPRPGITPSPQSPPILPSSPNNDNQFTDFNDDIELIDKVKLLNVNDDGILFNQKIKQILEHWIKDSKTKEDVERSFNNLYQASLLESELASKLIIMVSSRTFLKQEIGEQNIRHMFLKKLQSNFEDCSQLKTTNPIMFRNCVLMLGEFYNKARLANGQQFTFLSTPLIAYLEMLLDSTNPADLKLFTLQLSLNGQSLKAISSEKITEILLKIRLILISDKLVTKEAKLWLMLALDLANHPFSLLSNEIQKFYEEQLGDLLANCQLNIGSHNISLSIQTTQTNNSLDSYQSNVNVLQVSSTTTPTTTASTTTNNEPTIVANSTFNNLQQNYNTSNEGGGGFVIDSSQKNDNKNWEKTAGRPILGAGARFNKNKQSQHDDVGGNWRERSKENSAGWNSKQKNTNGSGWGVGNGGGGGGSNINKKIPKSNKGWEHDDRFETDYN